MQFIGSYSACCSMIANPCFVQQSLKRPAKKRRRKPRTDGYCFLALPTYDEHRHITWKIHGHVIVDAVEPYVVPDDNDMVLLSRMPLIDQRTGRGNTRKYMNPVKMCIITEEWYTEPLLVPHWINQVHYNTARLPKAFCECVGRLVIEANPTEPQHSGGKTMLEVFGTLFHHFPIWKCKGIDDRLWQAWRHDRVQDLAFPVWPWDVPNLENIHVAASEYTFQMDPGTRFELAAGEAGEQVDGDSDDMLGSDDEEADTRKTDTSPYPPHLMLLYLELKAKVKPSVDMRDVLRLAGAILGVDPKVTTAEALRVPARRTLDKATLRLDLSMMLWERHCWQSGFRCVSSWGADASQQSHMDFFVQRSEALTIRPDAMPHEVAMDWRSLSCSLTKQTFPTSCLGYGESGAVNKMQNVLHMYKILTGTAAALREMRWSIRGVCSDQGAEKKLCDAPNVDRIEDVATVLTAFADGDIKLMGTKPESYFFPVAVWVSGPLHIAWNAFETSCTANTRWQGRQGFHALLKDLLAFLGNRLIRQRFMETCMTGSAAEERALFHNWKHRIVDWKWEYMEETFIQVSASLCTFFKWFDLEKMKKVIGEGDGMASIDAACLRNLQQAQQFREQHLADAESFAVFARAVGAASRWFTGCSNSYMPNASFCL